MKFKTTVPVVEEYLPKYNKKGITVRDLINLMSLDMQNNYKFAIYPDIVDKAGYIKPRDDSISDIPSEVMDATVIDFEISGRKIAINVVDFVDRDKKIFQFPTNI